MSNMKILLKFDQQKEINFIDGLGTFSFPQELTRKELLSLYIDSAKQRTHWGDNIDPFIVIQHAKDRLKECNE
tara:strand:+ start:50 stop:268 length:219 start_codon:yes stop_codon:yes gene_type:complete